MNSSMSRPDRPRVCVIGAGPCGLTAIKNLLSAGVDNIVCYDESDAIGGNWVFRDDADRMGVYHATHLISSRRLSEFEDYPMPESFPDFPSHRQMLGYFQDYAAAFGVLPHIVLCTRVEQAARERDGGWRLRVSHEGKAREERFDYLLVCAGHHRDPIIPEYPGTFGGEALHSFAYRRPEPFRDKRVLVVGAGNSACDIAVDVARVASRVCISMRHGAYILPKVIFGRPVDVLYAKARILPRFLLQPVFQAVSRLILGGWGKYGLQKPPGRLFEMHPTLNTNLLSAVRDGDVIPRVGIDRLDGHTVHFSDGSREDFDAVIWGTGFRSSMPFMDPQVVDWDWTRTPPLYLKMMHRNVADVFFIGLFQPIGCIWRLADHQARIAALQIAGRLDRPADISTRVDREVNSPHWAFEKTPRHAIEVDYHDFRAELMAELARARAATAHAA